MSGSLTPQSLETLIDLVEVKLSCFEVWDRDDKRELMLLEHTLSNLKALAGDESTAPVQQTRRRGRPAKADHLRMAS
ncbi:hypothetical protein ACTL6U_01225 [Rhodovibrionaceae bacterium A322]